MPWSFVGTRVCRPGINTTLFGSAIVNENFAVEVVAQASTARIYWGMIEYCRTDIIPGNTAVIINPAWPFWGPALSIRVGNASAGGFVRFRLRKEFTQDLELNVHRFFP